MRFLRIENNLAVNAEEWDEPPEVEGVLYVASDTAPIGASYDAETGVFTDPVPVVVVPHSVSMRQARLALRRAGLLASVQAAVNAADEDTQIEFEFATDVWRDRDLVKTLGYALGLSDPQIDALFIAAAAIP